MWSWPAASRCEIARSPPSTSSTATEHWPRDGDRLSTSTTEVPRRCSRASREPALAGLVLPPACHVGEERVGHVEYDKPDRPAVPGAQLARGLVPDEPEPL